MPEEGFKLDPMPKGFLSREQFETDLTKVVRLAKRDAPESLETDEGRHALAQRVISEMLAIDEQNLLDIEHLADHMSDEKSGVILDIVNRDTSSAGAVDRMNHIYDEICDFEEHRDERHVPRKSEEPPAEE